MQKIKKQIRKLYLSSVTGNLSLTGAWVAILAARGYSLAQIGLAETVFHITSILLEIPSGVFADLFGRKKMLLVSSILRMAGNIVMIFSCSFSMICLSLAFYAANYNFASGSGGLSTLCAGFALFIGHRAAYGTDVVMCALQILIVLSLYEARINDGVSDAAKGLTQSVRSELMQCFLSSLSFLKREKKATALMFCNSFVGAMDILLLFFLQAKLPAAGMPNQALGAALFFMELGGIFGSKIILKWRKPKYRNVFTVTATLVFLGVLAEHSSFCLLMTAGGFLAAFADDMLQVRTNTILQDMFPSEQRATLISMESFTFSVIMVVLSPLAGLLFSNW